MKTIYEYILPIGDLVRVPMYADAQMLTVQLRSNQPTLWAIVDPALPIEERRFHWRGTGHPLGEVDRYIGTIQLTGRLVFHLFEEHTEHKEAI